jgi:SprT protein
VRNYIQKLSPYLPEGTAEYIARWIIKTNCEFRIARSRSTRFGDYRHPHDDFGHRISVNHDLNRYAFLITTVHEFAHLRTWNQFKNKVKPHGQEWKLNFQTLMQPFLTAKIFPADIEIALLNYLKNPAASSCTDLKLFRTLKRYDKPDLTNKITVESLPIGGVFKWKDGRHFRKIKKNRTRYQCIEIKTNRLYLFSSIAEIHPVEETIIT